MTAMELEKILSKLKPDKNGHIRGKNRAIDEIMSLYMQSFAGMVVQPIAKGIEHNPTYPVKNQLTFKP